MPEPFDTIARLRRQRLSDAKIAVHLGVSADILRARVQQWNRENPDDPLPPPDAVLRAKERENALRLLKRGIHYAEVSRRTGMNLRRVFSLYARARDKGIIPPIRTPPRDAYKAWQRHRAKRAAPPNGQMADVLRRLTVVQYERLIGAQVPKDRTMADIVARLLGEYLDDA